MADGRKNNGGHSTKGKAGRKPKADEIQMLDRMDATKAPQEIWDALAELIEDRDRYAIKIWLEYRYGKPKESKSVEIINDQPIFKIDLGEELD